MLPKLTTSAPFALYLFTAALTSVLGNWMSRRDTVPLSEALLEGEVNRVLKEMASGPLRGRNASIMLDDETENIIDLNDLVKSFSWPLVLLRTSQEDQSQKEEINFQLLHGVLIGVARSRSWWPLWNPLENWYPSAIILFVLSNPCNSKDILEEAPLLQKSQYLVLLCIVVTKDPRRSLFFKVWTWKPYAAKKQLLSLGLWNASAFATWDDLFVDRYQDLSKKTIRSSISFTDEPVLYVKPDGSVDGTNIRIMTALSQWLGFETSYEEHENNSWVGMRDMVRTGESDVMINYVTLTLERLHEFDVSIPYQNEGFGFIMKVPPPLPLWRNLYYPYAWEVWVAVVGSLFSAALVFHALNFSQEKSLVMNSLTIAQSLMSHPIPKVSERWRERCFLCGWDFMAWLLNLCYTCNLIAVLTVPSYPSQIQTAQELADSDFRVCMLDYGEFVDEALYESTHTTLSALGDKLDMVPMRSDLAHWGQEGCIERSLANTHAHLETYYFVKILYSELGHGSKIYSIKEQIYVGNLVFLFRRGTPWKGKFNKGMRQLIEAGLVAKFYQDILSKYKNTNGKDTLSQLKLLSLAHLQGPFFMLVVGLAAAVLVLAVEIFFMRTPESE